jgi:hypothetical protein
VVGFRLPEKIEVGAAGTSISLDAPGFILPDPKNDGAIRSNAAPGSARIVKGRPQAGRRRRRCPWEEARSCVCVFGRRRLHLEWTREPRNSVIGTDGSRLSRVARDRKPVRKAGRLAVRNDGFRSASGPCSPLQSYPKTDIAELPPNPRPWSRPRSPHPRHCVARVSIPFDSRRLPRAHSRTARSTGTLDACVHCIY